MIRGLTVIFVAFLSTMGASYGAETKPGSHIIIPQVIPYKDGRSIEAERGLFFVPENRAKADSRTIAVHFLRFRALEGGAHRPPVFLLPGGPGSEWNFSKDSAELDMVERLRRTRDVIYVSQRGNSRMPGLSPDLRFKGKASPADQPASPQQSRQNMRRSMKEGLKEWTDRGVDLAGYDILNIVDDVHELRRSLGYDKIVLKGCSFGSQWSLSYIKRWPASVERAFLSGVEPLDYAYDSPKWLWASMGRVAKAAEENIHLAPHIPRGGLMKALKTVIKRLEEDPVTVTVTHPENGQDVAVTVGATDLQYALRQRLRDWPRFILELYRGDYRYLALNALYMRSGSGAYEMITTLIDNSIGITAKRDKKLLNETDARWLGDINAEYHDTRDLTPTPLVGDDFRADWDIDIPILLVTGDYDWSTPVENARHASKFLKQGHLLEIAGLTHCGENRSSTVRALPGVIDKMYDFIEADFTEITPSEFFKGLPKKASLPPVNFTIPGVGPSLYEQSLGEMDK